MDSVKQPDITTQRDYIYDERAHYPKGHPAKPFIQCGLEPMSIFAAATNEMLLQSNEGKIRIFPAIPKGWAPAFKLRARGAFIVSSEMKNDGSIPAIYIESLNGNNCKVVNPWEDKKVAIWKVNGTKRKVKYKIENNNIIVFKTLTDDSYLIVPDELVMENRIIFKSKRNEEPKKFMEATLGKKRNF